MPSFFSQQVHVWTTDCQIIEAIKFQSLDFWKVAARILKWKCDSLVALY